MIPEPPNWVWKQSPKRVVNKQRILLSDKKETAENTVYREDYDTIEAKLDFKQIKYFISMIQS